MDILHASTELAPFAKVGGLADVTSALTKHQKLLGHRVTLVLPRYRAFAESSIMLARRLTPLGFELGGKPREAVVFDAKLASGVELVLIDGPGFDRAGIYGEAGQDYPDNAERFAFFSRAVVELVLQREAAGSAVGVVHAHDWPTALVPYFLARLAKEGRAAPKSVLTLHNLAHQGVVAKDRMSALGISWDDFHMDGVEFFGQANILKAGIVSAGALTTVSETYARDIVTPGGGGKLEGVLLSRKAALTGIVNGIDASVWNPATDTALPARYDVEDITNKARCKGSLLAELGLEVAAERPLAIFVGRLVEQKGADLLAAALPRLLASEITVAIAGDGDDAIAERLTAIAARHAGRVAFVRGASEAVVHRMFGGGDFVLVPSRFEPCGLVQLYGQRYGAVPVAHATGGLVDTIVDCDAVLETGTGFLFDDASADALVGAVGRARAAYDSSRWRALVRRVMRLDRGWERPARRYDQIYRQSLARLGSALLAEHSAPSGITEEDEHRELPDRARRDVGDRRRGHEDVKQDRVQRDRPRFRDEEPDDLRAKTVRAARKHERAAPEELDDETDEERRHVGRRWRQVRALDEEAEGGEISAGGDETDEGGANERRQHEQRRPFRGDHGSHQATAAPDAILAASAWEERSRMRAVRAQRERRYAIASEPSMVTSSRNVAQSAPDRPCVQASAESEAFSSRSVRAGRAAYISVRQRPARAEIGEKDRTQRLSSAATRLAP